MFLYEKSMFTEFICKLRENRSNFNFRTSGDESGRREESARRGEFERGCEEGS